MVKVLSSGKVVVKIKAGLSEYKKITPPDDFNFLLNQALVFKRSNLSLAFVSATPEGGGVAIMRHGIVGLFKLLGVNVDWYVLQDDPLVFEITKRKFHNVLQGVASKDMKLSISDKKYYNNWIQKNSNNLIKSLKKYDVVVIDDPQPSGLVPFLRKESPNIKIIYRSHIQILASLADTKGTPQNISWSFIWENIKSCDYFISHPVRSFVPKTIPKKYLIYAPPYTDPLSDLNKALPAKIINKKLVKFNEILKNTEQKALDLNRDYITQIARFDPSKGIPDLLQAYKILANKLGEKRPQLVIAGNGSVDDPDGIPILNMVNQMIESSDFDGIRDDIKVARLEHDEILLNAILSNAKIALQLSHSEGFEFKIAEALLKGKPVVIYDAGGMPLQVKHKITGFIAKTGDINQVAKYLHKLLTDKKLYANMAKDALDVSPDIFTVSAAGSVLWLANEVATNSKFSSDGKYIKTLSGQSKFKIERLRVIN